MRTASRMPVELRIGLSMMGLLRIMQENGERAASQIFRDISHAALSSHAGSTQQNYVYDCLRIRSISFVIIRIRV